MGRDQHTELTDAEIIEKYLNSQESSYFSILYKKYGGLVYAKSLSLLKSEAKAKDATQEIFLKVILNLSKFKGNSKFSTWLYSITYNYCIDFIRREKKVRGLFSNEATIPDEIIEDVPDKELLEMEIEKLKIVLNKIPVGDKAILLMKYQDDMKIKEIAEILKKTESAVKMKIKRAKYKARKVFEEIANRQFVD